MAPGDVLAKADRASMQVSLELRTPYLQRELVELAATVPGGPRRQRRKMILRRLLRRVLPGADDRPKTAFRTPTAEWLSGPLAPALQEHLSSSRLYEDGWFDRGAMRRLATEHQAGGADWSKVHGPCSSSESGSTQRLPEHKVGSLPEAT